MSEQDNTKSHLWPSWDSSLGKAPIIVVSKDTSEAYIKQLDHVLKQVSEIAKMDTTNKLSDQLKDLVGASVNILPGIGLPKIQANYMQYAPLIQFDPNAWASYPVAGAKTIPTDKKSDEKFADMDDVQARVYEKTEQAIASPVQLFIGEIGAYAMHHKARQSQLLYLSTDKPKDLEQALRYNNAAKHSNFIEKTETPALASAFSEFKPGFKSESKPRDSSRLNEMELLYLDKNGTPIVPYDLKAALDFALKVNGGVATDKEVIKPQSQLEQPFNLQRFAKAAYQVNQLPEADRKVALEQLATIANSKGMALPATVATSVNDDAILVLRENNPPARSA